MNLRPARRADWFDWSDPDPAWVREHAEVPGLLFDGGGGRITRVTMHRSHLPLVDGALALVPDSPERWRNVDTVGKVVFRSYQATDIPRLRDMRGSLLAYEPRMGKTCVAACAHDPRDGALVVVGPLAARDVWRTWIETVTGDLPIVLQGRKDPVQHDNFPAYFIHYDVLDAHLPALSRLKIGTLVLDEIHLLQGNRTRRLSAVNSIAPRAARIYGLTGTPIWSRPISMYSLLHLLNPGAWGSRHAFGVRWCGGEPGAYGWTYDGVSHEEEFKARLAEVVIRRTWKEEAPNLPPTTRVVEPVGVTQLQLAKIENAAMKASMVAGTTTVAGYLATLRRLLGEVKIKPTVAEAVTAVQNGHKVVVWAWHRAVADAIVKGLQAPDVGLDIGRIPVFRLQAEDSPNEREAQVRAFRDVPMAILVGSIAVGGVALDLSCADYAIFAELDWTPLMNYQAAMRTFHPSRPDTNVFFYVDAPVEQRLVRALALKEDLASRVGLGLDSIIQEVLQ